MAKQADKPNGQVEAVFKNEIKSRKGIRKTTRGPGEMYLSTCLCNIYVLTTDWNEIEEFELNHVLCE